VDGVQGQVRPVTVRPQNRGLNGVDVAYYLALISSCNEGFITLLC
jgi:hypothetical protein